MDFWNSMPALARQILIGLALFVTGGALAFGYSYRPLHGALSWKAEQLEQRLDERNRELFEVRDRLTRLEADEAERIDPDTFAQVERELEKTRSALRSAEKKLERAEKRRREANSSAARWRKRFEGLRDQQPAAAPASPAPGAVTTDAPAAPAGAADAGGSATSGTSERTPSGNGNTAAPGASTPSGEGGMLPDVDTPAPS